MRPKSFSFHYLLSLSILLLSIPFAMAQRPGFNYDEANVPSCELPDPLVSESGNPITSIQDWKNLRRPEILALFEDHVYGPRPAKPENPTYTVTSESMNALGGKATRKQLTIRFDENAFQQALHVLLYIPNSIQGAAPVFVGYNFNGNHTIHTDPSIHLSTSWMRTNNNGNINHQATNEARGKSSKRWPVERIVERGYALATAYYGDVEPDHSEGWKDGIRSHYDTDAKGNPLELEEWSAITAWAWGLSRIVDYLETDSAIDTKRIALMGHSRLGKTSLWAGATDERFGITISNNSGCGGAALSRRAFGETVKRINTSFPHWFNRTFKTYNDNEAAIPVDQHQLIALMAPRPVYVASAQEDLWADPNGEFLSAKAASPVYELFGLEGVGAKSQPPLNSPIGGHVGYHFRTGKHDVTLFDWELYLYFADRHFD